MSIKNQTHQIITRQRGETHNGLLSLNDARSARRQADSELAARAALTIVDRRLQSSFGGPDGVTSASGLGEPDQVHLMSSFGGADGVTSASGFGEADQVHLRSSFGGPDGVTSASGLGERDAA
jgi:hypothetical protein